METKLRLAIGCVAALICQTSARAADATPILPRAIYQDGPADPAHPAMTLSVELPSHGAIMNGIVYLPSGVGPFPLVILLHGLPGNEQNLDLAQAMRRAGWAVLTFHYRGAFGSEGRFSIDNVLEDADAAVADVHAPGVAAKWNVDPARIVLMGHSMGGLAVAHAAKLAADRLATVLLAPWDPSILAGLLRPLSPADLDAAALARWSDVTHGRLVGMSSHDIAAQIVDHGERWRLADNAEALSSRPLLIITATRDLPSSKAIALKSALEKLPAAKPDPVEIDSNHSFDDHRIALEATVIEWLAKLPGAPAGD